MSFGLGQRGNIDEDRYLILFAGGPRYLFRNINSPVPSVKERERASESRGGDCDYPSTHQEYSLHRIISAIDSPMDCWHEFEIVALLVL